MRHFQISSPAYFSDRPSPPRNVRPTEVQKDYIVIAWDESEFDGGSPITGYVVEKQDVKRQSWVQVDKVDAATRSLKATKLVEGNQYHFRVMAENDVGVSDPTQTDEPITAKLPFGKYILCSQISHDLHVEVSHNAVIYSK